LQAAKTRVPVQIVEPPRRFRRRRHPAERQPAVRGEPELAATGQVAIWTMNGAAAVSSMGGEVVSPSLWTLAQERSIEAAIGAARRGTTRPAAAAAASPHAVADALALSRRRPHIRLVRGAAARGCVQGRGRGWVSRS